MGNCLVTKLKETVDNPNLPHYGKMRIHIKKFENGALTDANRFASSAIDGVTIVSAEIVGGKFYDLNGNLIGTTISSAYIDVYAIPDESDAYIYLDKYGTPKSIIGCNVVDFDFDAYFSTNMLAFNIGNAGFKFEAPLSRFKCANPYVGNIALRGNNLVTGDIADIRELSGLENFTCVYTRIGGNILDIANMIQLINLGVGSSGVPQFNVEDFAIAQWDTYERKSGDLNLEAIQGKVDGVTILERWSIGGVTITYEADNIKVYKYMDKNSLVATYNGSTWTYNF